MRGGRVSLAAAPLIAVLVACGSSEPSDAPAPATTERSAFTTAPPRSTVARAPAEPAEGITRVCEVTAEGSAGKPRSSYTDATFVVGDRYRSTSKCSDSKDRHVKE